MTFSTPIDQVVVSNNNNISSSTLPFAEPIHKSVSLGSEVFFLPSQSNDIITVQYSISDDKKVLH